MKLIGICDGTYPGRLQSDTTAVIVLAANTEQHFTIPTGAQVAVFATTGNFFCLTNGQTAAVPSVTATSFPSPNTVPELNPTVLEVTAGNLMSVIASAITTITISFYANALSG